jgi:hypothetical protein
MKNMKVMLEQLGKTRKMMKNHRSEHASARNPPKPLPPENVLKALLRKTSSTTSMIGVAVFSTRSKMKLFSDGKIQPKGSNWKGMLMLLMLLRVSV